MKDIQLTPDQIDIIINALENRQNELDEQVELGILDESDVEDENKDINEILSKFY
jgi:hypothetical protein